MDKNQNHILKMLIDWFTAKKTKTLKWSSQSPDLNQMEQVLEYTERKVGTRKHLSMEVFQNRSSEYAKILKTTLTCFPISMFEKWAEVFHLNGYANLNIKYRCISLHSKKIWIVSKNFAWVILRISELLIYLNYSNVAFC